MFFHVDAAILYKPHGWRLRKGTLNGKSEVQVSTMNNEIFYVIARNSSDNYEIKFSLQIIKTTYIKSTANFFTKLNNTCIMLDTQLLCKNVCIE